MRGSPLDARSKFSFFLFVGPRLSHPLCETSLISLPNLSLGRGIETPNHFPLLTDMPILVLRNNEQFGPFELDELTRYVQAGNFLLTDYCWQEGWEEWRQLDFIVSLPAPTPVPTPIPIASRAAPRPSTRSSSASSSRLSRKTVFVLGGMLGLVLILFYYASPYWTLYQLKRAVDRNDGVFVADRVDFPQLRESFKGAVMANLAKEATKGEEDGMGALGAAFGAMMVGPMIDALVTPEGLIQMMQGRAMDAMPDEDSGTLETPSRAGGNEAHEGGESEGGMDVSNVGYETLNRFCVTLAGGMGGLAGEKESFTILFSRRGLAGWKLTGVRIGPH